MVAIGWRKLGDDGDDLCRALDVVLAGVETLKSVVLRNGLEKDEDGEISFCWKEMWCRDVLWTSADAVSNIETARLALREMKDTKNALDLISDSLDCAIETITDSVVQHSNETGLAKLPDDVLAQIFEICYLDEMDDGYSEVATETPLIFSSVCKRFRDIAIHLPSLWRNVSSYLTKGRLSLCAQRCRNPSVLFEYADGLEKFFDHSQPYQEWEELDMRFQNEGYGHQFFEQLGSSITGPFASLKRLGLYNYSVNRIQEGLTDRTILEVDELTLASWQFPNVTCLELNTVLPSTTWQCPNVTRFELEFSALAMNARPSDLVWSLPILRDFIQAMPLLESLELAFHDQVTFDVDDIVAPIDELSLPSLRTLSITLDGRPPLKLVSKFMDLIDTDRLSKLNFQVLQQAQRVRDWNPGAWLKALFVRSGDQHNDHVRSFPGVLDFALDVLVPESPYPSFEPMFASLPNVRFLSLNLPEFVEIDLRAWMETYGGLKELRTLRIQEYIRSGVSKYTPFLAKFSQMEFWDKFEKLEVVESSSGSFRTEELERYCGDKLVRRRDWKAGAFYPS